jgi:arylsulfatase A-like enzyme
LDIPPAVLSNAPCVIPDITATLLDYAGAGDLEDLDGRSLKPILSGTESSVRSSIYLEFGHTRTVIQGQWKYIALRYSDYTRNMSLDTRKAWLEEAEAYLQKCHEPFTFTTNDPYGPFGHSGYIPDGWSHERVAMNHYPHYYDADQLYDLSTDPGETQNLATDPDHAETLKHMQQLLKEHLENVPGGFGEFKQGEFDHLSDAERGRIGHELMRVVFH